MMIGVDDEASDGVEYAVQCAGGIFNLLARDIASRIRSSLVAATELSSSCSWGGLTT